MLENSYMGHYQSLIDKFRTDFTLHHDEFPKTIIEMVDALTSCKRDTPPTPKNPPRDTTTNTTPGETEEQATSFAQVKPNKPGELCWICGDPNHKKPNCPKKDQIPQNLWYKTIKDSQQTIQIQNFQAQALAQMAQQAQHMGQVPTFDINIPSGSASASDGRSATTGIQTQFSSFIGNQGTRPP